MAWGVLEPAGEEKVAGTVQWDAVQEHGTSHLKRDASGKHILEPQPSNDLINDPLNWSQRRRDVILAILAISAVVATTASPLLAADSVQFTGFFKITFQGAAELTAFHLAGVAVGAVIAVPSARVWGKRHVFLIGALLMTIASAWGGATHVARNFDALVWARIFQGLALAPFESLTNAVVGDLFYVHERGPRMACVNTAIFGGAFLTPVFSGMIAKNVGWQWTFYIQAIVMGVATLAIFFFVPETAFRRDQYTDGGLTSSHNHIGMSPSESLQSDEKNLQARSAPVSDNRAAYPSFASSLRIFTGRKTDDFFLILLLRPFPLYVHPAVLWGCLMQGVIIGWTVMVGVILSLVFLSPPLFFTEEQTGKLYTAAFIGAIVGLAISGVYTELLTNFMVKRNNGVYEPEFRILLAIPTLVFTAIGLYGFGITAANIPKYGWLIPDVFLMFIVASMVMGAVTSASYLLDAHGDIDIEIFTNLIIFKNIFSFALAYCAYGWILRGGIKEMFIAFGSIEVAICCLSLPMYIYGKRSRAFFAEHDILRLCRLR